MYTRSWKGVTRGGSFMPSLAACSATKDVTTCFLALARFLEAARPLLLLALVVVVLLLVLLVLLVVGADCACLTRCRLLVADLPWLGLSSTSLTCTVDRSRFDERRLELRDAMFVAFVHVYNCNWARTW